MITEEMIPRIEQTFGFQLYDWQKDYLLGKIEYIPKGCSGATLAYCVKLILAHDSAANQMYLCRFTEHYNNGFTIYYRACHQYFMKIKAKLVAAGFETRVEK